MTQPIPANRRQGHFEVMKSYGGKIIHKERGKRGELGFRQLKKYSCSWVDGVSFVITARRNARIASAVLATAIPSVCPSVCHTPVLCQNDCT